MTSEGAELDLYADDIGDEFAQENEYNDSDLYDDVITSNSKSRAGGSGNGSGNNSSANNATEESTSAPTYNGNASQNQISSHSNSSALLQSHSNNSNNDISMMNSSKKPCVYVGNLTWWTTDEDVRSALAGADVHDVSEVKFFENRANGQSKGFCVVTLTMDSSVRQALEKLPKVELHGQTLAVTMCNRQNLNHFEMKSRKPGQNGQPNNQNYNQNSNQGSMNSNRNFGQNTGMPTGSNGRPPLLPGRPGPGPGLGRPNNGPLLSSQPRLPQMSHPAMPFGAANAQQWPQLMQNGPRNNQMHGAGPSLNPMLRMPQGNNRSLINQPLLSAPNQGDLRTHLASVGLPGVGQHALNVNALFGSQQSLVNSSTDQFGNRFPGMNPFAGGHPGNDGFGRPGMDMGIQMGDAEFEEILSKNKNLANNAVSRAVSDASSGDYNSAIDTLATAISLISQSRVAHDDRCKIIISSLKDTLQGIESKSFSSGGHRKDRPRSRERSRERSSRRDKSRRERSRSREREFRERSRDRDRHYEDRHYDDRYRKEERERHSDRERRSRH